jgi:hypothetical protein
MNKTNPILTAVMSKLISDRDNVLAQLDLVLNKQISDKGVSGIVEQTTELFRKLSEAESSIETVKFTIESNANKQQFSQQIGELRETLTKLQEKNNTENPQEQNGNNNP